MDRSIESACKSYAHRNRVQTLVKIEQLSGKALSLPVGSAEWKTVLGEIVRLQKEVA